MFMKYLNRIFVAFSAFVAMMACSGNADEKTPEHDYDVPEGVLRIFADKERIAADGADKVTFTVAFGSSDVSEMPGMTISVEKDGRKTDLVEGVNVFTATQPGEYVFTAAYDYGGVHRSDNAVKVTAERSGGQLSSGYRQKMIAMQFTSTGCTYCPILSTALKDVQKNLPGKIIPVSFHLDYNGLSDPMALPVNADLLRTKYNYKGVICTDWGIVNEYSKIVSEIEYQESAWPSVSGVGVNSEYDASSGTVSVTARFVSEVSDEYRYHIFLLEDGIVTSQAGADGDYVHDNVFRAMAGDNILGSWLNSGKALEAGKEYSVVKTMDVKAGWNPENMRVVAILMRSSDGGSTWYSDNAAECVLDAPAVSGAEFQRHVCVMEFTGTWCAQCPDGATVLNYLVDRQYKGKAFALAFHNADEYSIPQEQELQKMFRWSGYPAYVTDMRDMGLLNDGGCDKTIEKSLYDTQTHCGVAVESSYEPASGTVTVKARLASGKTMNYRLAAYVVEDKVKGRQTLGTGQIKEDYTHRHVVRKMLSSTVLGDGLGEVRDGNEAVRTYTFTPDASWDVENLSVAVLAIDSNGHVNNMAECAADGGEMDYEYVNN